MNLSGYFSLKISIFNNIEKLLFYINGIFPRKIINPKPLSFKVFFVFP